MKKAFILPLLLLLFSAALGLLSPAFLEADELTHFLKARDLFHDWRIVLDIWGRPACTGLFGIAAALGGLGGARVLAVVITGVTGWGAMRLEGATPRPRGGEDAGYFTRTAPGWAWLLLYAQPLFLLNSYTVMTEMLLACAWVWAALFLWKNRLLLAGLCIGLSAYARPEGWFAIAAWPFFLWIWKRTNPDRYIPYRGIAVSFALSLLPTLLWWIVGAFAYGNLRWMIDFFPWQTRSQYGKTGLLFIGSALLALAFWMWVPVLVGSVSLWRHKQRPAMLLLIVPTAAFFFLHAVMGALGLMGALSLPRYFICVSPFLAVLGVRGLQSLEALIRWPRLLRRVVIVAAILPALVLILSNQLPIPKSTSDRQLDVAIRAFKERGIPETVWSTRILASQPYVYYALGVSMAGEFHNRIFHRDGIRDAPPGTYLITDALLWNRENLPSPEELMAWGYRFDPFVDQEIAHVPVGFDLNELGYRGTGHMGVGLWVKDR